MSLQISVLIPVFNGAAFIRDTIESILNQDRNLFELVIVDDGSKDQSVAIIESIKDPRIRFDSFPENRGVSIARNRCLELAEGDFLTFTAQDDVSHTSRCRLQSEYLENHPQLDFVGSNVSFIDDMGRHLSDVKMPSTDLQMRWQALFDAPARHSTIMVRSNFIIQNQLKYNPDFKTASDTDFILRMMLSGQGANLQQSLVSYRLHDHNASKVHQKLYHRNGDKLALSWINHLFPTFTCTEEEIGNLRKTLLLGGTDQTGMNIQDIKSAVKLYSCLEDQFKEMHTGKKEAEQIESLRYL